MDKPIRIRKGFDIRMKGIAEKIFAKLPPGDTFAIKPTDFHGLTPKLAVKPDETVQAGTTLFFDKYSPDIVFTSPVSGKVREIRRGEKRRILEVVIEADREIDYLEFGKINLAQSSAEQIIEKLLNSGLWAFIRQRPYGIIANPASKPKAIFISGFDTAPLAPDYDFMIKDDVESFQTGINALKKLTEGKIHIGVNGKFPLANFYKKVKNVELNSYIGKHPAGNVGVHINHINPINKGEVVWYLYPQDVITIGRFFEKGIYDASRLVALTGSEAKKRVYYKTITGTSIKGMVENNVEQGDLRYISGNVLTGTKIEKDGYLGFYDQQVTVIPEGNYYEFFGWAKPGFKKFSFSRSYWSWLAPGKRYRLDTNLHGGERAFVLTGNFEKVFPMNIYPQQLLKAILVEDIDMMENLGIYEVTEEDFALCEYITPSKIEIQSIVRNGLEFIRKETT